MWVRKLLIFPVEIWIFCPKTTKFGPKWAFLVNLGQAMQAYSMPCCGSVGGCGARAVSRKTPIYFMITHVLKRCFREETLPKAQRTRGLSSYHKITVHRSQILNILQFQNLNYRLSINFKISTKHQHLD